jgi:hypothetical protein
MINYIKEGSVMGRTVITKKDFGVITTDINNVYSTGNSGEEEYAYRGSRSTTKIKEKGKTGPDKYTERLLKYIPTEVIALYVTLNTFLRSEHDSSIILNWGIFVFGIIATYLYLLRIEKVEKQSQLFISVGAFCVWVFALGGPFEFLSWYKPLYASLMLPIYTFSVGLIEAT